MRRTRILRRLPWLRLRRLLAPQLLWLRLRCRPPLSSPPLLRMLGTLAQTRVRWTWRGLEGQIPGSMGV